MVTPSKPQSLGSMYIQAYLSILIAALLSYGVCLSRNMRLGPPLFEPMLSKYRTLHLVSILDFLILEGPLMVVIMVPFPPRFPTYFDLIP